MKIEYNRYLKVNPYDRDKFENFVKLCAIRELNMQLINNVDFINEILNEFDLNVDNLLQISNKLIVIRKLQNAFLLEYNDNIKYNNIRIKQLFNMIDSGSTITGLPKPFFNRVFTYMHEHIYDFYLKYQGYIK